MSLSKTKEDTLKKMGIFTLKEALKKGFNQTYISRMVAHKKLEKIDYGTYLHINSTHVDFEHLDFIIAKKRFGSDAVIGLHSALFYHGLMEHVPKKIWVLVPSHVRTTSKLYKLVRVQTNSKIGIEKYKLFNITNIERTIVEAFRYYTKVGLDVAIRAARIAIKKHKNMPSRILHQAKLLKMEQFIIKYWEAIVSE